MACRFTRICVLAFVFVVLTHTAGAARAAEPSVAEWSFTPETWPRAAKTWKGSPDKWETQTFKGTPVLHNAGGKGAELARRLDLPSGQPVTAMIGYGWRFGTGAASAELELLAGDSHGLVLVIHQKGGAEKYELFALDGKERRSLGTLADDTADRGAAAGGLVEAAVVSLTYDPAGKARIERAGGAHVELEAPVFAVSGVLIRDTSPNNEQLRLTQVRGFVGEADPRLQAELSLPIGALFTEGESPEFKVSTTWVGGGQRDVRVALIVTDNAGRREVAKLNHSAKASSGEPFTIDTTILQKLGPGLYSVTGEITDGSSQPGKFKARFGVLSKELQSRPKDAIPQWFGVVPYINVLPQSDYAASFALLNQMGVRHVRWLPGWGRIEPEKDQYEWSESDEFIALCKKYGISAMFCLSYYGVEWTHEEVKKNNDADGPGSDGKGPMAYTPFGRQLWVDHFAVPTIERYGDYVKDWQIWNEPDAFWNDDPKLAKGFAKGFGTSANYYDLFVRTHRDGHAAAKKAGHDGIRILTSLASGEQKQNIDLLMGYGLADHFDGIILHTYGNHLRHFQNARKQLADYGFPDAALGSGETGIPTAPTPTDELRQATRVAEVFLGTAVAASEMSGPVVGVDWFVLHDRVANARFGLFDESLQPQPAALAFATLSHLMSGATSAVVETRGDVRVFRVERTGRSPLWVAVSGGSTDRVAFRMPGGAEPVLWNLAGESKQGRVRDGLLVVPMDEPVVLIEGDLQPAQSLALKVTPSLKDGQPSIRIHAEGDVDQPVTLTVRSEALGLTREESMRLQDGKAELTLPLGEVEAATLYPLQVGAAWDGGLASVQTQVELTPVSKVTPEEAAGLQRPDHLPTITLGEDAYKTFKGDYGGAADSSAVIAFGYSDNDLVVWIQQTDDKHMPINPEHPWVADGPQLAIDPAFARGPGAGYMEINFGIAPDGPFAGVYGQPHYSPQLLAQRDEATKTTHYRLAVPLSQLQLTPTPNTPIGLSLILNDNDGDGRQGWTFFGGGIAEEKNPALFRQLILE